MVRGPAGRLDVDAIQQAVGPQRGDGLGAAPKSGPRAVTIIRAERASASWYTRVADKMSRSCASSTMSSSCAASRPNEARAARSSAAGFPSSAPKLGMSIRWLKAPNGTTRSVGVPVTQRVSTVGWRLAKCSAARRASVDLPTPSGPSTTAPGRAVSPRATSSCCQGGRVLGDVPSNRHRRILRCGPSAG